MKEFCCGEIVPGCSARFRGQTEEEILGQVAEHAREDHHMSDVPEAVVAQVRSLIRPVVAEPSA